MSLDAQSWAPGTFYDRSELDVQSNPWGSYYDFAIRFDLFSVNGVPVSGNTDAVVPKTKTVEPRELSFSQLSVTFPDARVRWSDARGRSGTSSLSSFRSERSRRASGVVHLEVMLPDGRAWRGSVVD